MKEYDIIVIGSGAGMIVIEEALAHGLSTALVDKGPLGGTCLNVGCIPSKMLIYPADRTFEIKQAKKLGIAAEIKNIDFSAIMERMRKSVSEGVSHMREGIKYSEELDFYEGEGRFVKDYTLEVKGEQIKGKKIILASGARPDIPLVKDIDAIPYLTNETVLKLNDFPESIVIIGGGYIAAEYAHFFSALGTKVILMQRNERLVPEEESEISELLKKEMGKRMTILTNTEVTEVKKSDSGCKVTGKDKTSGKEMEFTAEKILIAAGRKSNVDLLKVETTGIETDERNYIKVNEYFETSKKNIWAFGDAIGKKMFRHSANKEASLVAQNVLHNKKLFLDYRTVPHAVFSYPEIASVGLTEEQALKIYKPRDLLTGKANYSKVARGEAMMEEDSFAKAIVKRDTMKILGFHIIGPHASILIQEVVNAIANDQNVWGISKGIHIHPALPELIIAVLGNLEEPE